MEFPSARDQCRDNLRRGHHRRRPGRLHGSHSRGAVRPESRDHRASPACSAAPASTSAASPPRLCSSTPKSGTTSSTPPTSASTGHRHAHAQLAQRPPAQKRHRHQARQGPRLPDEEAQDRRRLAGLTAASPAPPATASTPVERSHREPRRRNQSPASTPKTSSSPPAPRPKCSPASSPTTAS